MNDRELKLDNGWVDTHSATSRRLYQIGYSVGGYVDKGVSKYVLYRMTDNKFERVHGFDSEEELNNMIKLLLAPNDEG